MSDAEAASVGVTFIAAWVGLIEYARVVRGEKVAIIGAAGGVGSAGVQLARWMGAIVFGVDRAPGPQRPDFIITASAENNAGDKVRELTGGRGVDVVLNAVGGPMFNEGLEMLARRGRMAILASPAQRQVPFELDFYHNESQLYGVDTLQRDLTASAAILNQLGAGFENGSLKAPAIHSVVALDDAVAAYELVSKGA